MPSKSRSRSRSTTRAAVVSQRGREALARARINPLPWIAVGGAVVLLSKLGRPAAPAGTRVLTGPAAPGVYVQFIFEAWIPRTRKDAADEAVEQVRDAEWNGQRLFNVVAAAPLATSVGWVTNMFATVVGQSAFGIGGMTWEAAMDVVGKRSPWESLWPEVRLVEATVNQGGPVLSLARQDQLATRTPGIIGGAENALESAAAIGKIVLVGGLAFWLYKESKEQWRA